MDNKNNIGIENTGDRNSGDRNSGDWNSGDRNSGNWNSGYWNSGYGNSGYGNSGDRNSGYGNSGYGNSGDRNSGDWNSGMFNTNEPKMRMFNKDSEYTYSEFREKFGYTSIELPLNDWIYYENMSEDEKKAYPMAQQMGGYLKTLSYKEAWKVGWDKATKETKEWYQKLPNFSWEIFTSITGIEKDNDKCKIIEINGKKYQRIDY